MKIKTQLSLLLLVIYFIFPITSKASDLKNSNAEKIKFCAVYEFDVKPMYENEFKKQWHDITIAIRDHAFGLGSRLHKVVNKPHAYVAYAQWPSREAWLKRSPLHSLQDDLMKKGQPFVKTITVYELEVVDNLLVS